MAAIVFRKPAWWSWLLLIVAEVGFISAARWQWQRGEFKDRRLREFEAALAEVRDLPVADFTTLGNQTGDYIRAHLRGRLLIDQIYLHDNRVVEGEYGVDVYVPLAIAGGYVLVNLGWIPADRSRRTPPEVPQFESEFDAEGLLAPAPAVGWMNDPASNLRARPALRLNIVPADIAAETGLTPMLDRVFWPAPVSNSPFRRNWRPSGLSADRHRGYALQWAGFAVTALALFVLLHSERKEDPR